VPLKRSLVVIDLVPVQRLPIKTKFNRPAATDDRENEGPHRRVRLNARLGVRPLERFRAFFIT